MAEAFLSQGLFSTWTSYNLGCYLLHQCLWQHLSFLHGGMGLSSKHSSTFSNLVVEILLSPTFRPPRPAPSLLLSNTIMQISRDVTHIDGVISEQNPHPGLLIFSGDAMVWATIGSHNHVFVTLQTGGKELHISKFLRSFYDSDLLKYIISAVWEIMPWSWNRDYLFAPTSASFI